MSPLVRRQAVVVLLILAAAVAAMALRVEHQSTPAAPPLAALLDGSWRVDDVSPGGEGAGYRQALLVDPSGHQALLYVGVTPRIQSALRWNGALGFQGEGYLVTARRDAWATAGGRRLPVAEETLERLGDRLLVQSAVVGPHGVARQARDLLAGAAWDLARGGPQTYFMVRVAVPATDGLAAARAGGILGVALSRLAESAPSPDPAGPRPG